jgi:AraC-like DNA-binding protein
MYEERPPPPHLRSLVACFWSIDGRNAEHRVLPDGAVDVVVIDGVARLVGTMTRAFVASPTRVRVHGVRFLPGEATRIFGEAAELTDEHEILGEASDLETMITRRLASRDAADLRVRAAIETLRAGGSVSEAARRACLSERQLSRRFRSRVGVGPKTFARVMRLQRAAGALASGASPLAAACHAGYADQAHFTREASDLAGVTPSVLASEMFKTPVAFAR